ncbi:hypothetical protein GGX14DRAFT_407541 [Mycena pura]|uniref:Uncharacterized protein n=1 Tax=Mycena pura TaxID=153505 RepID=A0AAD6UV39_9AGAR|nr:hypothetical protein GGX14DRAFT_407541 [Mycena pura]
MCSSATTVCAVQCTAADTTAVTTCTAVPVNSRDPQCSECTWRGGHRYHISNLKETAVRAPPGNSSNYIKDMSSPPRCNWFLGLFPCIHLLPATFHRITESTTSSFGLLTSASQRTRIDVDVRPSGSATRSRPDDNPGPERWARLAISLQNVVIDGLFEVRAGPAAIERPRNAMSPVHTARLPSVSSFTKRTPAWRHAERNPSFKYLWPSLPRYSRDTRHKLLLRTVKPFGMQSNTWLGQPGHREYLQS